MPGSILGIDNHLALAIDVAISSSYIPMQLIWDPDHLCFGISGPGGPFMTTYVVQPDYV